MKRKQQSDQVDFQNDALLLGPCISGDVLIGSDYTIQYHFESPFSETSQISKEVDRKATRTCDICNCSPTHYFWQTVFWVLV